MMNLVTTTDANSYADQINKQFRKSTSHYVDLPTRLNDTCKERKDYTSTVDAIAEEFRLRNPNIKKWSDIELCRPGVTTLDKIVIDTTLQRLLTISHVANIVDSFKQVRVMPVAVYEDSNASGKYVCWDGQHTAIALMIIAARALGENLENCEIPINIYPSTQKSEMRENFIYLGGPGKLPIAPIDFYQQMIFGVRTDDSTNPEWLEAEQKQQYLEQFKIFATAKKFNDIEMPGALTRVDELMSDDYSLSVTEHFSKYFFAVCRSNRPVQPKEVWMLYDYFQLCENDPSIEITDKYIRSVARALKVTGNNDFNAIEFASRAKYSWKEYFRANKPYVDGTVQGIWYSETRQALTFMLAQLSKDGIVVPKYSANMWDVPLGDLF